MALAVIPGRFRRHEVADPAEVMNRQAEQEKSKITNPWKLTQITTDVLGIAPFNAEYFDHRAVGWRREKDL